MEKKKTYEDYVTEGIIINNKLGISEVNTFESIKSLLFIKEEYLELKELFQSGNIAAIKNIPDNNRPDSFREILDIMSFEDQNQKKYIVTVYDSTELMQDPQVIDIFPLQ